MGFLEVKPYEKVISILHHIYFKKRNMIFIITLFLYFQFGSTGKTEININLQIHSHIVHH